MANVRALDGAFGLDFGDVGLLFPYYFAQDCKLGQNRRQIYRSPTPSPKKKAEHGKMVCFGLRVASSLISGGSKGGSLFHFILFKIVGV